MEPPLPSELPHSTAHPPTVTRAYFASVTTSPLTPDRDQATCRVTTNLTILQLRPASLTRRYHPLLAQTACDPAVPAPCNQTNSSTIGP